MADQSRKVDQIAMDERIVESPELESALEDREKRRASLQGVRVTYQKADEKAKGLLQGLDIPEEGAIRIGRFRVTRRVTPGRSVSFDTKSSVRIRIATKGDE